MTSLRVYMYACTCTVKKKASLAKHDYHSYKLKYGITIIRKA